RMSSETGPASTSRAADLPPPSLAARPRRPAHARASWLSAGDRIHVVGDQARRQLEEHEHERLLLGRQALGDAAAGEGLVDLVAGGDVDVAVDDAAAVVLGGRADRGV